MKLFNIGTREEARSCRLLLEWMIKNASLSVDPGKTADDIVEMKRALRKFAHREVSAVRIIKGDMDGYLSIQRLPDRLHNLGEAEAYFDQHEAYHPVPSPYDCTGRPFTCWFKVCQRDGRFYAYHSVGFDL